jgi:hypothetical protein
MTGRLYYDTLYPHELVTGVYFSRLKPSRSSWKIMPNSGFSRVIKAFRHVGLFFDAAIK